MLEVENKYWNTFGHILDSGELLYESDVIASEAFSESEVNELISVGLVLKENQECHSAIPHSPSDNP